MPLLEQKTKKLWGPGQSPGVTRPTSCFHEAKRIVRAGLCIDGRKSKNMKVKDLILFLESYDESAEVEIEVFDTVSETSCDSTYDIGIRNEPGHPVLTILTDRSLAGN